jgi:hypothetical protein
MENGPWPLSGWLIERTPPGWGCYTPPDELVAAAHSLRRLDLARTYHDPKAFVAPMAAQSVAKLPEGDDWLYDLKLDGYRALVIKEGDRVQIRSRNDKDLTRMYPRLAAGAQKLMAQQVVLGRDRRVGCARPTLLSNPAAPKFESNAPDRVLRLRCAAREWSRRYR